MNFWEASTQQQTQAQSAWLDKRRLGLGGSEIAIILGVSPYRTQYSLWLEKTGRKQPDDISALPHVQRGVAGEKAARLLLERKYLSSFTPKTWELGEVCRCSDDGYSLDRNWILEIKCMGRDAHAAARDGVIPEHYRLQCQWNLMVSGADKCLFVSYRPEDEEMIEIEVLPNIEEHKKLKTMGERWWEVHVKRDMAPSLTPKDYVECKLDSFTELATEYKRVKELCDVHEKQLEDLRKSLCDFVTTDVPAIRGAGIKVSKTTRKGAIDYKGITELKSVDLESYRKPGITVTTITIEGDANETT